MPIVLSYNDVEALGALAHQAGYSNASAARSANDQQLVAGINASRDQTAARLQQISASERQAEADRALRRDLAGADQQFRQDQLASQEATTQARLDQAMAEAGLRAEAGLAQELLGAQTQFARDERQHQQGLETIEAERRAGKYQRADRATTGRTTAQLTPHGVPNDQYIKQEIAQLGHLVPYDTDGSGRRLNENVRDSSQRAESFSSLPTASLRGWLQSHADDPWAPYVQSVIQSRSAGSSQTPGTLGPQTGGAMPEGAIPRGARPGGAERGQGYGGGTGFSGTPDPRFSGLSDQQLQQLANDPAALQRYLGQ